MNPNVRVVFGPIPNSREDIVEEIALLEDHIYGDKLEETDAFKRAVAPELNKHIANIFSDRISLLEEALNEFRTVSK